MTWAGAEVGVWVAALPLHWSNLVNAFVEKKKKKTFFRFGVKKERRVSIGLIIKLSLCKMSNYMYNHVQVLCFS